MSATKQDMDELSDVIAFLCGEKPLQGRWFGEKYDGIPMYWWRNHLRVALATQRAKDKAAVLAALPESKQYLEASDIADHWGMTEHSIGRQIDNMKGLGFNEALDQAKQAIEQVFEG